MNASELTADRSAAAYIGLFPGQGSQSIGMGRELFDSVEASRQLFELADKALGFSLSEICFNGPLEKLTLTEHAQPAILTASTAAFRSANIKISAAAGHSLGEYSALVAAGVLRFEDAVVLVHKRGRYMQEAVPAGAGKMVAILGPSDDEVRAIAAEISSGVAEIANLNCPGQTVAAGDAAGIDAFAAAMKSSGAKVIPLNVSAPFHCSLMKPAEQALKRDLEATTFADPIFPVYSNVSAAPIKTGAEARELLERQVCSPVRWSESMQNMIRDLAPKAFLEFGPGGVLSNLMKRIDKAQVRIELHNPATIAAFRG